MIAGSKLITVCVVSSPPPVLYHYTTPQGLLGILQNDSIWATKIHYLNDASEYQLALDIAAVVLQRLLKEEHSRNTRRKIKCLLDNLRVIEHMNVCVCSFSAHRDVLSQWRAYAGHVAGYSLGFRTTHIQEKAKEQGFLLEQCVYKEEEQRILVEKLVADWLEEDFNTTSSRIDPARPRTIIGLHTGGDFSMRLAQLAPVIKSDAFCEEGEWRLISASAVSVKRLSFRPGKSMLTPYVPFEFGTKKDAYLESITVGPTPHTSLSVLATKSLLAHWDAGQNVKVHSSTAPYRSW